MVSLILIYFVLGLAFATFTSKENPSTPTVLATTVFWPAVIVCLICIKLATFALNHEDHQ